MYQSTSELAGFLKIDQPFLVLAIYLFILQLVIWTSARGARPKFWGKALLKFYTFKFLFKQCCSGECLMALIFVLPLLRLTGLDYY